MQPVIVEDLSAYFHEAAKPQDAFCLGAEFEKFAVEATTGRALGYDEADGIRATLAALVERFGYQPHTNRAGYLTALLRDGATISLEPGGQLELSTAPAAHMDE